MSFPFATKPDPDKSSRPKLTEEQIFTKKLAELGLTVRLTESTKFDYGILLHRLEINILRGDQFIERTTGGFKTKNVYREEAYYMGNKRLYKIESYDLHLKNYDNK